MTSTAHRSAKSRKKPARKRRRPVVVSDPDYLSGMPRFAGTRVPFKNLIDYLAGGDPLDEFLDDFPGVTREQAIESLALAQRLVEVHTGAPVCVRRASHATERSRLAALSQTG
jgi:uncharacterized protein (DUF433 family)